MSGPDITEDEIRAVEEVIHTPILSIGPRIASFESELAQYVGARHAVGVSSGTAGLHECVLAAGVSDGDLVITTPFSFIASANVILYERAVPIFVDVEPDTLNIDPNGVTRAADDLARSHGRRFLPPSLRDTSSHSPLKAILPVHAFGQPADLDPILAAAHEHGLAVIEDACEAIGAEYKGRKAGTLGDAGVFAFYPNKQMTTGEGGMIVTDHDDWDALFRSLRNQGRDVFDAWLNHSRLGYNYRMDEMSAALGLAQVRRLDTLLAKRERVAQAYNRRLQSVTGITVPFVHPNTTRMSWFVYVIRFGAHIDRDQVMRDLADRGVPARPYFTPIHLQPFYRERFGYSEGDFPITEAVAKTTLALPFFGNLSEDQVDFVGDQLEEVLAERSLSQ